MLDRAQFASHCLPNLGLHCDGKKPPRVKSVVQEKMEPISKIANMALEEITAGKFTKLPSLAITGLLNDFQYSWLSRFNIDYKLEVLDLARILCNGKNKQVFKATRCKDIEDIRKAFSVYINAWCKDDDRVIVSLSFDGKKINAEWIEMKEYLELMDS